MHLCMHLSRRCTVCIAEDKMSSTRKAQEMEHMDDKVSQERLRLYELSKLRYYYAIVTCDAPETAAAIYEQCDGLELEKSQSMMDLR